MRTIDKLKSDKRVAIVDIEDDGVILTLCQGWSFDPLQDNRVAGGDTATEALAVLRTARPYAGPFTD